MSSNPFAAPDSELLRKPGDEPGKGRSGAQSPSREIFTRPRSGGGGAASAKAREAREAAERAEEDRVLSEQDVVEEPPSEPKPEAKISNGRWLGAKGQYGQIIQASVDVILPQNSGATRVTFEVRELLPGGKLGPTVKGGEGHVKDGKAIADISLPEPAKVDGLIPKSAYFMFIARHIHAQEHQGPRLEAGPGSSLTGFESVIYYSPIREEYLHFETQEEFETLLEEAGELEEILGGTVAAWETADPSQRKLKLKEVDEKVGRIFGDKAVGNAGGAFEELLLVRQYPPWGKPKSWLYISPYARKSGTVRGHWRKETDAKLKKNLEDLLKKAPGNKEASPLLDSNITLKILKERPGPNVALKWWKVEKEGKIADQHFTFTKEAALCRFAMGFDGVKATANLKKRKLKFGTSGYLEAGLLEGSMEGKIPCPEDGVNLLEFLRVKGMDRLLKQNRHCLLRLNFVLGAKGFAGLSVKAALTLPHIDLSKEKPKKQAEASVKGEALLGAQGSESLAVVPEWSQTISPAKFDSLGKAQVDIGASVGLAAEAKLEVGYANGKFRFRFSAGAAFGIGPRGGVQFEVGLEEGWKLVGHLLHSVDYHFVEDIKESAFNAYKNYSFTLMTEGKGALIDGVAIAGEVIGDFTSWLDKLGDQLGDIKKYLCQSSIYGSTLAKVPPEALGQALITIMQTRQEEDFNAIMSILYSTVRRDATDSSADHKLKWTLRSVSGIDIPEKGRPDHEPKKKEAMQIGIRIIQEFGEAGGGWAQDRTQKPNREFLAKFKRFLTENGIQP